MLVATPYPATPRSATAMDGPSNPGDSAVLLGDDTAIHEGAPAGGVRTTASVVQSYGIARTASSM